MRLWSPLLALSGIVAAGLSFRLPAPSVQAGALRAEEPLPVLEANTFAVRDDLPLRLGPGTQSWTLIVSGDTDGYLSPCGCTAPMTGGIRRKATAIQTFRNRGQTVLIDTGGLGGEPGRQSEMKAETMAQSLAALDAAAINLTARDARLGRGTVTAVTQLAEGRVVSTSLAPGAVEGVKPFSTRGPFLIGGISPGIGTAIGVPEIPTADAVASLVAKARTSHKTALLMVDGGHDVATSLARRFPGLGAVVYRRNGWPPDKAERVGNVWLFSPGEHGKAIAYTGFGALGFTGYGVTRLGPEFKDDPKIDRFYRTYLARVSSSSLLERVPRLPSAPFAGSAACAPCHAGANDMWVHSAHSHALTTLEQQGHGRDPDCVSCHVTGLTHEGGFRSRAETPQFAFVGCESCHGPAGAHAGDPSKNRLEHVGREVCTTCHTADQSPRFDFLTYWRKISHK